MAAFLFTKCWLAWTITWADSWPELLLKSSTWLHTRADLISWEIYTPYEGRRGTSPSKTGNFTISKSKSSRLSYILDETKPLEIERCKIINGRPRECHNKKAQSIPSTKRKRNLPKTETTKLHVNNSRKTSSLFPNRGIQQIISNRIQNNIKYPL